MRIKFLAGAGPAEYQINGSSINGIDFSLFKLGSQFVGNEQTQAAGIFDAFWQSDKLYVVLAQPTRATDMPWAPRGHQWINASDYNPEKCYVTATDPHAVALLDAGLAEYIRDTDGRWSVRMIKPEAESVE